MAYKSIEEGPYVERIMDRHYSSAHRILYIENLECRHTLCFLYYMIHD